MCCYKPHWTRWKAIQISLYWKRYRVIYVFQTRENRWIILIHDRISNLWNELLKHIVYQPSIWSYFYILEMQRSEIASFEVHKRQFKHSILSSHNRMLHSWLFHGFLYIMLLLCHRRWKIASQVDNRYQWNLYGSKLGTQQCQILLGRM